MITGYFSTFLVLAAVCQLSAQTVTVFDTVFHADSYGSRIATMYVPSEPNGVGVVLGHWWTGQRQTMRCWAESLAAHGYTAMAFDYYDFDYRASICKYPKPVTTFKLAVEFLRRGGAAFGVTTGKIVGLGQSEGSIHWAQSIVWDNDDAFFGTDPTIDDRLDAVVLIYGAYDTENILQAPSFHMNLVWDPFFSAAPELRPTKGNAIANVENITTPVLLFHAIDDAVIRYEHSVAFHDSLQAHGKVSELHTGAWGGHTYDVPLNGAKEFTAQGLATKDIVLGFLQTHVLVTSLESPPYGGADLPGKFALYQNYPNPFNPSTTVRYIVPQTAEVTLAVYNMLGERVALLVSNRQVAGSHQALWDASNQVSGVYFYRLRTGEYVGTKKAVLVK